MVNPGLENLRDKAASHLFPLSLTWDWGPHTAS